MYIVDPQEITTEATSEYWPYVTGKGPYFYNLPYMPLVIYQVTFQLAFGVGVH